MEEELRQALEVLRTRGWCKHELENSRGQVCARGAINLVTMGDALDYSLNLPIEKLLMQIIKEQFPERHAELCRSTAAWYPSHGLAMFNNHKDTTLEDMEMILEKAINMVSL